MKEAVLSGDVRDRDLGIAQRMFASRKITAPDFIAFDGCGKILCSGDATDEAVNALAELFAPDTPEPAIR
jgi:hypothetical protein